ncbi:hypothetical protein RFI_19176 [Reticulomyxa filosa]|uniref:Uncharacterized protein n=1 Tax=Reticulomyxa filosa TaxID=46433 RepID=X6MW98_RETFI|nr:hypothetical protein RFI_19176 [Reticulomyxa filosa]|eukprot:ETO18114.1 hypothetical protein RFI_19176 [Reticulomyxa filosa]
MYMKKKKKKKKTPNFFEKDIISILQKVQRVFKKQSDEFGAVISDEAQQTCECKPFGDVLNFVTKVCVLQGFVNGFGFGDKVEHGFEDEAYFGDDRDPKRVMLLFGKHHIDFHVSVFFEAQVMKHLILECGKLVFQAHNVQASKRVLVIVSTLHIASHGANAFDTVMHGFVYERAS